MEATATQRITQAALVTAEDLQILSGSVASYLPPLSATAECADRLTRQFPSINELVAFDNAPSRAVRSLTVESRAKDYSCSLSLTLDKDDTANVRYTIRGREESVLALRSAVDAFLSATRPAYWPLARINALMLAPLLIVGASLLPAVLIFRVFKVPSLLSPGFAVFLVGCGLFGVLPVYLATRLNRLRAYLFPMCLFSWQQGQKHAGHLSYLRTVVLVGLIISVAGSIIAGLITIR